MSLTRSFSIPSSLPRLYLAKVSIVAIIEAVIPKAYGSEADESKVKAVPHRHLSVMLL